MEKMSCNIIYDLLPLYLDGLCSEESQKVVEEHLEHCQECGQALELMKKDISIEQDNDAEVIKKVKHRIRIEKTVVGAVIALVLCAMMFLGGISLIANQIPMNDLLQDNDVRIKEDENGDVWLVRSGNAVYASHEIGEQYTEDGKLIIGMDGSEVKDYEGDRVVNMVLLESRMSKISQQVLGETSSIDEEKSLLFNVKDNPHYCKVQITLKDHVHTLWERDSKEE